MYGLGSYQCSGPTCTYIYIYIYIQGFIQEFVLGGGYFVSGVQWACEACPPRGGLGVLPQKCF